MNKSNTVTCSFTMDRDTYDAYKSIVEKNHQNVKGNLIRYMQHVIENGIPNADTLDAIEKVQSKLNASTPTNSVARHSDESLLSLLEHSDRQYHDGKAMNMRDAIMDARKQHGYKCGHEIFSSN